MGEGLEGVRDGTIRSRVSQLYSPRGLTFVVGLLSILVPAVSALYQSLPDLSQPPTPVLLDLAVGLTVGATLLAIAWRYFTYRSAVHGFAAGVLLLTLGLVGRSHSNLFSSVGAAGFVLLVSTPIPLLAAPGDETPWYRLAMFSGLVAGPYLVSAPIAGLGNAVSVLVGNVVAAAILAFLWVNPFHHLSREVLLGVWSREGHRLVSFSEAVPDPPPLSSRETVRMAGIPFLVALNVLMLLFQLGGEGNVLGSRWVLGLAYVVGGLGTGVVVPAFWWFESLEISRLDPETRRTDLPPFPLSGQFLGAAAVLQLFLLGLRDASILHPGAFYMSVASTLAVLLIAFPPVYLATLFYVWRGWRDNIESFDARGEYTRVSSACDPLE